MLIDKDKSVSLTFEINWSENGIRHTDGYFASQVNMWRDCFPKSVYQELAYKPQGEEVHFSIDPNEIIPKFEEKDILEVPEKDFDINWRKEEITHPRLGRYYPKGMLKGVPGVFKQNVVPFRLIEKNNDILTVNFNHPLARTPLELTIQVISIEDKKGERGGSCVDWLEIVTDGPGMQKRVRSNTPTDFFSDDPFRRPDEQPDTQFYEKPRITGHIDSSASAVIAGQYGNFLKDGDSVLDLMSSVESHFPGHLTFSQVVGLGLNDLELKENSALSDHIVQDLNTSPVLPFPDHAFDAVTCALSVEYLTNPFDVFKETARVLKPGGHFIVSFSNRWFPPKATHIWTTLHEFERMGLVLEYFMASNMFEDLGTYSFRGLPRPDDDKYASQFIFSDPVYMVRGRRKKS